MLGRLSIGALPFTLSSENEPYSILPLLSLATTMKDPGINLNIWNIPTQTNKWTVQREIAKVLHSDDFGTFIPGRLLNFEVFLEMSESGGIRNNGRGNFILPIEKSGYKFLDFVQDDATKIKIDGKTLRFSPGRRPDPKRVLTLSKTPYVNPDLEEEHQNTLRALEGYLRVDIVQFGIFYRDIYPLKSRKFSIEWEKRYIESYATLSFHYDHKLLVVKVGSELVDRDGYNICVTFASIQKIAVGFDGRPYICFETITPPVLDEIRFHRTMTGDREVDNRKFKQRVGSLNYGHEIVSPYAPHLRLELYNDSDAIDTFTEMCKIAGISSSIIVQFPPSFPLDAAKKGFFTEKRLSKLKKVFRQFDWPIAFQLESLLHNGLLNTDELEGLIPIVAELNKEHSESKAKPGYVGDLLRLYNEALQSCKPTENPMACFQRIRKRFIYSDTRKTFRCCHVTFTPTRLVLEGPYATQSNRVIRLFPGFEDHFIRVDFRDEDRLRYNWDREVDGTSFLHSRVGGILKDGFDLAGRHFEFLAYSNSSLREHAVWFMNPFNHSAEGWVTSELIRQSLGNFEGDKLLKMPSKYAARLAQAFTATDQSVEISRSEWEEVEDIGWEPYLHTDGVGTISRSLAKKTWQKICEIRRTPHKLSRVPSVFQIRFLGYKGVVAIDEELDRIDNGIHMRLRPSMRKFNVKNDDKAPIEIAGAFEYPTTAYLNRPLVMLLEDVGVRKEAFLNLQHLAEANARTIDDSLQKFEETISYRNMGSAFGLRDLLKRLATEYNMDLKEMDNPFFRELRRVAMNDILRDIKHSARIPIENSYLLVGVSDEGPAYEARGYKDVFCLSEGQIFVCIQKSTDDEPAWLEGNATISRSPVAHIGDVQRVRLVGEPPKDKLCFFRHLRNVVVMPSRGKRSLASCLGGGDLDGDLFSVICHETLLPTSVEDAANYESAGTLTVDHDTTVDDICDFIVQYIDSDVLGLLSDKLLIIADQSNEGMRDDRCQWLAKLCSQAVDFSKQGIPVELDDSIPRPLIRCKPDWHAAEVVSPRKTDYYESSRALGYMFRDISLKNPGEIVEEPHCTDTMADPITRKLFPKVLGYLEAAAYVEDVPNNIVDIFKHYQDEMRYICATHTLSKAPGTKLLEAEVVIGTILAKCIQKRWRKDRIYRMREHVRTLVQDIKQMLVGSEVKTHIAFVQMLEMAWKAWNFSIYKREEFAANSFGLVALSTIFDCFDELAT